MSPDQCCLAEKASCEYPGSSLMKLRFMMRLKGTCVCAHLQALLSIFSDRVGSRLWMIRHVESCVIHTAISNNIRRELSSFIRHKAAVNVKLRCFQNTRKLQSWFSVKDQQALLNRFNVVYKLTCSCGASYIGQTQRNIINCTEEHRTSPSSSSLQTLSSQPR